MVKTVLNRASIEELTKAVVALSVTFASPHEAKQKDRELYEALPDDVKKLEREFRPLLTAMLDDLAKKLADENTLTSEKFNELVDQSAGRALVPLRSNPTQFDIMGGRFVRLGYELAQVFDHFADEGKSQRRGK